VSTRSAGSPQVSVVTPLFNCLRHTQAMIESLRASMPAGVSFEIILVDDGSTDGTREWLAGLGDSCRCVLNDRNLGYGASTNRGAAQARGTVLALLNNDLILRDGWLGPMLRALRALGRRAGVVGNVQFDAAQLRVDHAGIFINLKGKPEHDRANPSLASVLLRPVRRVAAVTGACVLINRETWLRLGGYDETFVNGCEDIDLCLRAREAGLINAVALRSCVFHHVSSSPGRKLRDEQNTRELVLRWRRELGVLGSRDWTLDHFRRVVRDPRDFPDPLEACRMALFLGHGRTRPPVTALAGMDVAIEAELARWRKLSSD
jgi:GT2 family glycosyltransferase